MRYGVIGCGKVFQKRHWPSLRGHPRIQFAMLCDINREILARVSQETGVTRTTTNWRDVVNSDVDAVLICTLPDLNVEVCEAAAAAGKHIYCEKPIACTITEGRRIIAAARQAGVKLCVGHQRRFCAADRKAIEIIRAGQIGEIFKILMSHNLPNSPNMWPSHRWWDWRYLYSHGRWLHWAAHYVDLICYLMNDEPVKVVCEIAQYGEGGPRLSDTDAIGIFRFRRGGMGIVEIGGSQFAVHPDTLSAEAEERTEICGTNGSIFYARARGLFRTNIPPGGWSRQPNFVESHTDEEPADMYAQHRRLHEAFLETIEKDSASPVSGEHGLRAVEMILGGYLSMIQGRAVTLPLSQADIDAIEALRTPPAGART
ncbi:Gfo/Idh/MocA family protein [Fontivita pretiosa]|uniref:Gfo/Idh/MocA family protein n=1 Tax=Fontivita pretiosa TaxID=2989684 RepID=UPI003D179452